MPRLMNSERFYEWATLVHHERWAALDAWADKHPLEIGDVVDCGKSDIYSTYRGVVVKVQRRGYHAILLSGKVHLFHLANMTKVA